MLAAVANNAILAEAEIAIRHRPTRAGEAVDTYAGLGCAEQLVTVGETRRRVPERGGSAICVDKAVGSDSVLRDNRSRKPGRLLIRDAHRLLDSVDDADRDRGHAPVLRRPLAARG